MSTTQFIAASTRVKGYLMQALSTFLGRVSRRLERLRLGLDPKQYNERQFWKEEIDQIVAWYRGERVELYGVPAPRDRAPHSADVRKDAILAWFRAVVLEHGRYLRQLMLPADYFEGKTIADIGCGPMGSPLVFTGCQIYGVDPLSDIYRGLGYPLDQYASRMQYLSAQAESIPLPDASLDAVISCNAIDHVDDFAATAREIARVLKPGGILRMEVHYHASTTCEPWQLSDELMTEHYGRLGMRKLLSRSLKEAYPNVATKNELVAVWGTTDLLYRPDAR